MRTLISLALALAAAGGAAQTPPTLAKVRSEMGIASKHDVRGQRDAVGFASTAEQMATAWNASGPLLPEERLGAAQPPGVVAVVCPHDDYLYAGRIYKAIVPLVTARTVVLVGVFHGWKRFGARDVLVLDGYRAWRTPDGELAVSPLRDELRAALTAGTAIVSAAMHDGEHSLEALAYWLHHSRPEREIVPVLVATSSFERLQTLAGQLGAALVPALQRRGWQLGRDVAVVISSDAVHYGPDFGQVQFGDGGVEAYEKATGRDRALLTGPLAGPVTVEKLRQAYETWVDPADPGTYRVSWCGRFSIPFWLLLVRDLAARLDLAAPVGVPVAYGTSVGGPEITSRESGLGVTAPANLYHFVGYPGLAVMLPPAD